MAFSAILGLAGNLYAANQASKDAAAARSLQMQQMESQRQFQNANFMLAQDARRERREQNQYLQQIEALNRRLAGQEREFQMSELDNFKRALLKEREADIERQILQDKEAARLSTFRLEQLLKGQDISEQERAFAIQQLNLARSTAAGERDEELRRFLQDRAMAQIERDFLVNMALDAQDQARLERAEGMAVRDQILNQILGLQGAVNQTASQLGYVPIPAAVSEGDIQKEIDKRTAQNIADVDRAAEAVASVGEAGLIRQGMDDSTKGTAVRGDIAARLANEYSKARDSAYDDALKYISGREQVFGTNVGNIMDARSKLLAETAGIAGTGLQQLANLPSAPSALSGYNYARMIPSSIINRNISSANDFRAPVAIGSAIYNNPALMTSSLANYSRPTSLATNQGFSVKSGIFNPAALSLDSSNYLGNATSIGNQMMSQLGTYAQNMQNRATTAGQNFGQSFGQFVNDQSQAGGMKYQYDADGKVIPGSGVKQNDGLFYSIDQSFNKFFNNLTGS